MFNRSLFNRAPFNRYELAFVWSGKADIICDTSGTSHVYRAGAGAANIVCDASGVIHITYRGAGAADVITDTAGSFVRIRFGAGVADVICTTTGANLYVYSKKTLELVGINMVVNDVLTVNTDTMTVLLNGVNVNHLLTDDSFFFLLKRGVNELTVIGGESDTAAIEVNYRDRWL